MQSIGDEGEIKGIGGAETDRKIPTPIPRPEFNRRARLGSFKLFFNSYYDNMYYHSKIKLYASGTKTQAVRIGDGAADFSRAFLLSKTP